MTTLHGNVNRRNEPRFYDGVVVFMMVVFALQVSPVLTVAVLMVFALFAVVCVVDTSS